MVGRGNLHPATAGVAGMLIGVRRREGRSPPPTPPHSLPLKRWTWASVTTRCDDLDSKMWQNSVPQMVTPNMFSFLPCESSLP